MIWRNFIINKFGNNSAANNGRGKIQTITGDLSKVFLTKRILLNFARERAIRFPEINMYGTTS